jgi:lysophospholipase L1-like esterase
VRYAAAATSLAGALGALTLLGTASASAVDGSPRTVLDLGDSLSIGTAPYLRTRLRGYRVDRLYDVGLHPYDAAEIVARARPSLPDILVISAGTNDDPRIVSTFIRAISRVVEAAGARRCVVWPTLVRPRAVGATYDGLNLALTRAARRHRSLVLVDWVGMVHRHPRWLSKDGVHVSVAGYRARAAAIATAVSRRCVRVA